MKRARWGWAHVAGALLSGALLTSAASGEDIGRTWLTACLKTAWQAEDSGGRCIGRVARHCRDRPEADTTHGEMDCYRREARIWDGMLNGEYQALLAAIEGKGQQERLREAQRQWLRGQAADCEMPMVLLDGTMAQTMVESCRMQTTAERALMLRRWRLLIARE